jgi:hypothetical protein
MHPRLVPTALAFVLLLAACTRPALAGVLQPMLPLEIGNHWEYRSVGGAVQVETITGTRTVLGREVFVKTYSFGPDAGVDNWWQTGPGGEVLLAGFDRHDGFSLGYDPPITMCGGSPTPGDAWTTHVVAYDMTDPSNHLEFDITFRALEVVSLSVPAGTFSSVGVGQDLPPVAKAFLAARGLALDGRRASAASKGATPTPTDWFSAGVGEVQYTSSDLFQLVGYGNPTPALQTTWGGLKRLYH